MKTFWTLVYLTFCTSGSIGVDYTIKNFEEMSGIYFQDMGPILIYQKSCRILNVLDLKQILIFDTGFECVFTPYEDPDKFCEFYTNLKERIIAKQRTTLENLEIEKDKNTVHDTFKILYGSLDSEDLHFYKNLPFPITKKFQKNSTLIINSTFASTFPNEFIKVVHNIKYSFYRTENIQHTNLLFDEWETEMNTLNLAVLLSKIGKIHPLIFTPENLINVLKNFKQYFKGVVVPFELDAQNYDDIINISNLKVLIWKNKLIYDLEVPMIESENYRLYQLVPWPMKLTNQNTYFFIESTEDFVAVKAHDHSYIPFTDDELQTCKKTKQKKFCLVSSLMINYKLPKTCELSMISNNYRKDLFSMCTVKLIKFRGTVWYRLDNENSWIFTTSKDSINVTCLGKESAVVTLRNSGSIRLNKSCVAVSNKVTLKPFQNNFEMDEVHQFQFFKFNLASDVEEYIKNLNVQINEIVLYDFGNKAYLDLRNLKLMGTSLDRIKIEASNVEKYNGKEETGRGKNSVINKNRDLLVIEINNLIKNQHWLWTIIILMYLIFVCYVLYDTQLMIRIWNLLKNRGRKRNSVLESQEFSTRQFLPREEPILSENDTVSVHVRNAEDLPRTTDNNLLKNWPE